VGDNADARGTEAVKLSVKLLSGLTLVALVAVAVIGLSHSASAAADAKVYVTNDASKLTTEASPPSGRTNASTVYGTYNTVLTTGTSARDIVANSNRFIVTVIDNDLNTTTTVTANASAGAGFISGTPSIYVANVVGTGFDSPGERINVTLVDESANPVVGALSEIRIVKASSEPSVEFTNISAVAISYPGDGTNAAIITLQLDYGTAPNANLEIQYPSSAVDVTTASIKSVVDTTGSVVILTETGRDTGRFEGYVLVKERTVTFTTGADGGLSGLPATVAVIGGPVTVSYNDVATAGTATNVPRTGSLKIDVTTPTATITSPITASESQNRLPTFTGNVTDNQSGIDVSTFELRIDRREADAANTELVILPGLTNSTIGGFGTVASINLGTLADGVATFAFSYTETTPLPDDATNPDGTLDFQVRVADLAGNFGYSDSDTAKGDDNDSGRHGNQPHTIKIDQVIPQISKAESGFGLDTSVVPINESKANVRDTIKVTFDGKIKDTSVSPSDFSVVLSGSGGTFVPASVTVRNAIVYLDLDSTIPSDNTPTVKIQGTIQDLAGNSTDAGSAIAVDKLAPVLTVVQSAGSGTGTGAEGADQLTADKLTVTVASDEDLQGPPSFTVTDLVTTPSVGNVNSASLGVAQGSNTWVLIVTKASTVVSGDRAVKVEATDSAGNKATVGKDTTKTYRLDLALDAPTSTPANSGTTTEARPFLTTNYSSGGEKLTVSITVATLDTVDVTSGVIASNDSKTFFFQPTSDLTDASHTYVVKGVDAAGNKLTTTTVFTKSARSAFEISLFAGWNLVSVPSDPQEFALASVFSNAGISQVVSYDATRSSQPWNIATKSSGSSVFANELGALPIVKAGVGYWVRTTTFEAQKVSLEGPVAPGTEDSPELQAIPTGNGWNLVGVLDQSRIQTQSSHADATLTRPNASGTGVSVTSSTYFNTVNNGRAYTYDTVSSSFRELVGTDTVTVGSGIWVFISPRADGEPQTIVP